MITTKLAGCDEIVFRGFMKVCCEATRSLTILLTLVVVAIFCVATTQAEETKNAQTSRKVEAVEPVPANPKNLVTDFFGQKLSPRSKFEGQVISVDDNNFQLTEEQLKKEEEARKAQEEKAEKEKEAARGRMSKEAPESFQNMVVSFRLGDMQAAEKFADQYLDELVNLMFEVKQISTMLMNRLVSRGETKQDDLVGVGQYLDIGFAEARDNNYSPLKPTHQEAMKRIKADPQGQAEIYYFFTLACTYCRNMAGDIERLWQVSKGDPNVKMVALTITPETKGLVESYRQYTGLTAPIMDGRNIAKSFGVGFVPALVVVSPNGKTAYLKSGQQNFVRMYEFVRTVQGIPAQITPELQKLVVTPIGEIEKERFKKNPTLHDGSFLIADKTTGTKPDLIKTKLELPKVMNQEKVGISRF